MSVNRRPDHQPTTDAFWARASYDVQLYSKYVVSIDAVIDYRERRLADEFGDPGRVLERQFLRGTLRDGRALRRTDPNTFYTLDVGVLHVRGAIVRGAVEWEADRD